jgi:hypothetical protein
VRIRMKEYAGGRHGCLSRGEQPFSSRGVGSARARIGGRGSSLGQTRWCQVDIVEEDFEVLGFGDRGVDDGPTSVGAAAELETECPDWGLEKMCP